MRILAVQNGQKIEIEKNNSSNNWKVCGACCWLRASPEIELLVQQSVERKEQEQEQEQVQEQQEEQEQEQEQEQQEEQEEKEEEEEEPLTKCVPFADKSSFDEAI